MSIREVRLERPALQARTTGTFLIPSLDLAPQYRSHHTTQVTLTDK
jgi:hypothetical protein